MCFKDVIRRVKGKEWNESVAGKCISCVDRGTDVVCKNGKTSVWGNVKGRVKGE